MTFKFLFSKKSQRESIALYLSKSISVEFYLFFAFKFPILLFNHPNIVKINCQLTEKILFLDILSKLIVEQPV